ncbi:MAG: integrin alpha, partial [Cyanobacteria bacterium J06648_11]
IILGASGIDDEPGETYVFFGTEQALPASIESQEIDGTNGFVIAGVIPGEEVGFSVSDAGDINGDGIADVVLGAPSSDEPLVPTRSYVVFGSRDGFPERLPLASLNGANGFAIAGLSATDEFGHIVSGIGDINGDGLDDIAIGAPTSDANGTDSGSVYVVFGSQAGFPALLDAGSLNGNNGFAIDGLAAGDRLGDIVSQAGDLNADGIADILLGAPESDVNGDNSGQAYAIFGSQSPFPASLDLNTLDGSNGFIVNGLNPGDELGESVSGIGDFNGDGIDDIALGAPDATTNGNEESGQAYVIYGRRPTPTVAGGVTDDVLEGTDEGEIFEAGAGDDAIAAGGGDDTIAPGAGNDTIDGGAGNDTVRFEGNRAAFPIQIQGDVLRVGSNSDFLTNIETLEFTDTSVEVADLNTQLVQVNVDRAIAIELPHPVSPDSLNLYDGAEAGID